MEFQHRPVMLAECLEGLNIRPDGIYLDGTAGGAGHSAAIAAQLSTGRLIALDKDPTAVAVAADRLAAFPQAQVIRSDFSALTAVLDSLGVATVDGILLDLGVSSYQLDTPERGFSYHVDAPLDMRMSGEGISAYDIINTESEQRLAEILWRYGEEKFSRRIAALIAERRAQKPIETTFELVDIVRDAIPAPARREGGHPAKRTFQAIRIAVNGELDSLSRCLDTAFDRLSVGGRFVILTFQSLEDRIVKEAFAGYCKGCICPPEFPVCVCGRTPRARLVNRKPITAAAAELEENKRSKSAKLRILEKLKLQEKNDEQ